MAVETFTREQFEAALPKNKVTGVPLWSCFGIQDSEYVYLVPVTGYASIKIRSSLDWNGVSAATGEDSIRLWLVDPKTQAPMGAKLSKYVTRVKGWDVRLVNQLRELWKLAKAIEPCHCGQVAHIYRAKAETVNQGRLFMACPAQHANKLFQWLEEPKAKAANLPTSLPKVAPKPEREPSYLEYKRHQEDDRLEHNDGGDNGRLPSRW